MRHLYCSNIWTYPPSPAVLQIYWEPWYSDTFIFIDEAQIISAWQTHGSCGVKNPESWWIRKAFFTHRKGNLAAATVVITTVTKTVSAHEPKIMNTLQGLSLFTGRWNAFAGKHWYSDNNGRTRSPGSLKRQVGRRNAESVICWLQEDVRRTTCSTQNGQTGPA